jgi:PTS system galactitol-specific IIA component
MQAIQDQQKIEQLLQAENQRDVQAIFNGVEKISTKGEK